MMRQVREILKLRLDVGLSTRVIVKRLDIGETSVRDTVKRLHPEGLTWPVPETISDSELERKHVTLQILWEECMRRR